MLIVMMTIMMCAQSFGIDLKLPMSGIGKIGIFNDAIETDREGIFQFRFPMVKATFSNGRQGAITNQFSDTPTTIAMIGDVSTFLEGYFCFTSDPIKNDGSSIVIGNEHGKRFLGFVDGIMIHVHGVTTRTVNQDIGKGRMPREKSMRGLFFSVKCVFISIWDIPFHVLAQIGIAMIMQPIQGLQKGQILATFIGQAFRFLGGNIDEINPGIAGRKSECRVFSKGGRIAAFRQIPRQVALDNGFPHASWKFRIKGRNGLLLSGILIIVVVIAIIASIRMVHTTASRRNHDIKLQMNVAIRPDLDSIQEQFHAQKLGQQNDAGVQLSNVNQMVAQKLEQDGKGVWILINETFFGWLLLLLLLILCLR